MGRTAWLLLNFFEFCAGEVGLATEGGECDALLM